MKIEPYEIVFADAELRSMKQLIRGTRWPDRQTVSDWSQGVPLEYLRDLCAYWADVYDWRRCEERLNRRSTTAFR